MKRSHKWCQDKKLRRFMKQLDKNRKIYSWRNTKTRPYRLLRKGWKVQYELSRAIKKSPIGEFLNQVLYILVEGDIIEDIKDFKPKINIITGDEYKKLTTGQKVCFVKSKLTEEERTNILAKTVNGSPYQIIKTYETGKYELDPHLVEHIIPIFYKNFAKIYQTDFSECDELEAKAKRENLYIKASKIMGWSQRRDRDWFVQGKTAKGTSLMKQVKEDIKEMM